MQEVDRRALGRQRERARNRGLAHSVLRGFRPVHHKADFGLLVFHVPIDVHDTGGLFHDPADFAGEGESLRFVGTINFRDDRLQHRWAGRHLGHRDGRPIFFRNGGDEGT